jgi:putative protein kinase ArgK-like GTPase of G3E family
VWSNDVGRLEVRTLGQAVSEIARRFSALVLTREQLELLASETPLVFLTGPPGSGKTSLLVLKAVQWVKEGRFVCVLSCNAGSSAFIIFDQVINNSSHYSMF